MRLAFFVRQRPFAGLIRGLSVNLEELSQGSAKKMDLFSGGGTTLGLQHYKGECAYDEASFDPILSGIAFE